MLPRCSPLDRLPLVVRLALAAAVLFAVAVVATPHHATTLTLATLVLVDNGEGRLLNNFLNKVAPQDWTLRVYQNNITPAETDVASTYTEATWAGYAAKALVASNWTVTEGAPTSAAAPVQTFTSSATQTLQNNYGYYFTQSTSGILGWAERFSGAPFPIQNINDNIQVTPQITAD